MAKKQKKKGHGGKTILFNKSARHEYFITDTWEAGLSLEGWEVKSLREAKVQIKESYIFLKNGEAWLYNAHISPLNTVSTHITAVPLRHRKLLMHATELARIIGMVERKGFTLVPLELYWKNSKIKLEVGLGKGKQQHDKRAVDKERDWNRDKQRLLKNQ